MSEVVADAPGAKRWKKTVLALAGGVAAGCVIAATVTGISLHRAETARLCEEATASIAAVSERSEEVLAAADASLAASTDDAVQTAVSGAGSYSTRPPGAQGGSSSRDLVTAVERARSTVAGTSLLPGCDSRAEVDDMTDAIEAHDAAVLALVDAVDLLDADVREFSDAERARIAAERAAAEKAAAEAAAQAEAAAAEAAADLWSWTPQHDPGWAGGESAGQSSDPAPGGGAGGGSGGDSGGGDWDPSGVLPDSCEATNSCVRPNL